MINKKNSLMKTIFLCISLTGFVAAIYGFGIYLFAAIMPDMKEELNFTYSQAGITVGLAQISFMLFAMIGGAISTKIGGALTCLISVLISGVTLITIPFLNDFTSISLALILLGGMAASGYVPIVDILTKFVEYKHRGKAMGLISSGTSFGVFINGLIIPIFILQKNWHYIWISVGILTLIWLIISIFIFKYYGLFEKNKKNHIIFDTQNSTNKKLQLFQPIIIIVFCLTFLNGLSVMPFQNFLVPFLREEMNYSMALTSQIWALIGFSGMLSGFMMGALSDKIGIKITLIITYSLLAASSYLVIWSDSIFFIWVAAISFSFAFYPIFGLIPAYVSKIFGASKATLIFAIANVTLGIGGMVGNILGGYIKTYTGSFQIVYIFIVASSLISISLVLFLISDKETTDGEEQG